MSDLNRDQLDVLEVALDVVIAAAKSDAAPYFDEKGLGFLAALEGMDPPLTVVPLTPAASDESLDVERLARAIRAVRTGGVVSDFDAPKVAVLYDAGLRASGGD